MIVHANSLSVLQVEWQGVIQMRERIDQLVNSAFAFNPVMSPIFENILYNLPAVLAFDVLRHALLQANSYGISPSPEISLSELLENTKTTLPWVDWQSLHEGAARRTEIAQAGRLIGDKQCLQDIATIEAQLVAWDILPPL